MLELIGDFLEDEMTLPNGMVIKMDFGDMNLDTFGIESRYMGRHRRVQLFDKKGNVLSVLIEDNPFKLTAPDNAFNTNIDGILF